MILPIDAHACLLPRIWYVVGFEVAFCGRNFDRIISVNHKGSTNIIFILQMRKQSFLQNRHSKWIISGYVLFLQIDYVYTCESHDCTFVARPLLSRDTIMFMCKRNGLLDQYVLRTRRGSAGIQRRLKQKRWVCISYIVRYASYLCTTPI